MLGGKHKENELAEPLLKVHGADAAGTIFKDEDGRWNASLLVRNVAENVEQKRGPQSFDSVALARTWIAQQAIYHGFASADFDIQVEEAE